MTETSTSSQIISTAPYHSSLLQALDSLQYAPSALSQQTTYLRDLQAEFEKVERGVKQLGEKTKKERKEHEELRDSTARRLAARLKGKGGVVKYEAKKEKEEREYIEALENEMRERGKLTMLESMIQEAQNVKADLEEKSTRLGLAKEEISNLYRQVFDGPTAEFPQEDAFERELASAQEAYDRIQEMLNSHSQAVNLLAQADTMLDMSLRKMDEALRFSTWDVYGGGGISDMMERDALSNGAMYAAKAEMLITQAQRTSRDVQDIGSLRVDSISLLGDVFFDNLFSDIRAHQKIQKNRDELGAAHRRLKSQLRAARQRAELAGADLIEASEVLSESNKTLEEYRREVFLRIAHGEAGVAFQGSPAPGTESRPRPSTRGQERGGGDMPPGYGDMSNTTHLSEETLLAEDPVVLTSSATSFSSPPPPSPGQSFTQYYPPPLEPPPSGPSSLLGRRTLSSTSASNSVEAVGRSSPSMRMPEPSMHRSNDSLSLPPSTTFSAFNPSSRRSPSPSLSPSHRHRHRRSRSFTPTAESSSSNALSPNPSSTSLSPSPSPGGHRRSRSSVSVSSARMDSRDKDLPAVPSNNDYHYYPPPPGPPPSTSASVRYAPPPGPPPSNPTSSSSTPPVSVPVSPGASIPAHWGNKNPFAAMMMK